MIDSTHTVVPSPLRFHFIEGAFRSIPAEQPATIFLISNTIVGLLQLTIEIRVHSQEEEEQN